MGQYEITAQPVRQTTWIPGRDITREADVIVPFMQAAITAVLLAIAAGCCYWAVTSSAPDYLRVAVAVFGLAWLGTWIWTVLDVRQSRQRVEELFRVDLDGDGAIGKPGAHPFPVGSNPRSPRQTEDAWHAMAEGFVNACFRTRKTGERAHVGHRFNGERLTQAQYDELRGILIAGKWARVKPGIRGGWEFRPELTAEEVIAGLQKYREERSYREPE